MKYLVVEDDPAIRDILVKVLTDDGGVVDAEACGEDGLRRALMINYDLILLDINLPRVSGWDIAKKVVEKTDTPIIFITARDATEDVVKGIDIGADDYLVKPFHVDEVRARVRLVLRRKAKVDELQVELVNGAAFDVRSRAVFKDGEMVDLRAREISLLELFALNRGKPLTKEWIVEHLLNDGMIIENPENLVEVNLYRLRKKLGANVIVTRRGVGYELGS